MVLANYDCREIPELQDPFQESVGRSRLGRETYNVKCSQTAAQEEYAENAQGKKGATMDGRTARSGGGRGGGGGLQILGFPRDFAKLALSFRKKAHPIFLSGEYLHLIRMT